MSPPITRRRMLGHSAISALAIPWITGGALAREVAPEANSRVGVAIIGCGRRGDNYLAGGLPARTRVVATCDVNRARAEKVAQRVNSRDFFKDYRRILDRPDVDGGLIATPDH